MQATEQTTTPDTEKEWKILNQLSEIAADIENQTSYYSFQSEEGNPVFDTLLVDVKSWISQLQSLVPNTISHDDVPVVLPDLTATTSSSVLQQKSWLAHWRSLEPPIVVTLLDIVEFEQRLLLVHRIVLAQGVSLELFVHQDAG